MVGIAEYGGYCRVWRVLQSMAGIAEYGGYCRVWWVLQSMVGIAEYSGYCRVLGELQSIRGIAEYCFYWNCRVLLLLQSIAFIAEYCAGKDGWICDCISHRSSPQQLLPPAPPSLSSRTVPIGTKRRGRNRRHDMTPVCLLVIAPSFDGAITW